MKTAAVTLLFLALGLTLMAEQAASKKAKATLPLSYSAQTLPAGNLSCLPGSTIRAAIGRISADFRENIREAFPVSPCGPGWTRVAHLNMTLASENCPAEWLEHRNQVDDVVTRGCGRAGTGGGSCNVVSYSAEKNYSSVCGRMVGYQYAHTDAFWPYNTGGSVDLDGVVVSHGDNNNDHIWSFVVGLQQLSTSGVDPLFVCPCAIVNGTVPRVPPYIGNNYFCESSPVVYTGTALYVDNPLWDGDGCTNSTSRCCAFNSPPYFNVELDEPTADDIKVKICGSASRRGEDVVIEQIEIYVK